MILIVSFGSFLSQKTDIDFLLHLMYNGQENKVKEEIT